MSSEQNPQTAPLQDPDATQVAEAYPIQLNVLIVADDVDAAALMERLLVASGYRVVHVRSAFMAREALAEQFFPIVIIGSRFEDGDPLGLCAEVRQGAVHGYVFILLMAAHASREEVLAGLAAGADDYLSNTFTAGELLARCNTASRIVRLERSLREALEARAPSTTDALTGGHNRRHFVKQMGRDLQLAQQAQRPLSILIMDLDYFKSVNDRHGYVTGDELLRQFANRVRFALPHDQDWIARIGGEEFVVVLPGTDIDDAIGVAEKLRRLIDATPFHVADVDLAMTISLGVASLGTLERDMEVSAQALLDQADQYLYRSKLRGRNRVSHPPFDR